MGGDVEQPGWFGSIKGAEDGFVHGGSAHSAGCSRVEFLMPGAPVLPVAVSIEPDAQQHPAPLNVGADEVLAVVNHRAHAHGARDVSPAERDVAAAASLERFSLDGADRRCSPSGVVITIVGA